METLKKYNPAVSHLCQNFVFHLNANMKRVSSQVEILTDLNEDMTTRGTISKPVIRSFPGVKR